MPLAAAATEDQVAMLGSLGIAAQAPGGGFGDGDGDLAKVESLGHRRQLALRRTFAQRSLEAVARARVGKAAKRQRSWSLWRRILLASCGRVASTRSACQGTGRAPRSPRINAPSVRLASGATGPRGHPCEIGVFRGGLGPRRRGRRRRRAACGGNQGASEASDRRGLRSATDAPGAAEK